MVSTSLYTHCYEQENHIRGPIFWSQNNEPKGIKSLDIDQRGNKEGRKEIQYIYLQFIFSQSSLGNGNEDISSEKAFRKVENQEILIYY
jgi:hypothetical protein